MEMDMSVLIINIFILLSIIIIRIYLNEKNRITEKDVNCSILSNIKLNDIDEIIDKIINDSFSSYMFKNISYNKDIKFISDDRQKSIIYEVAQEVIQKISPSLLEIILIYYKEEQFYDIIANRVYFIVNEYCAQFNQPR